MCFMTSRYKKGIIAEFIAASYLSFKGYRTIKRRYSNHFGEIDLICRRGDCMIFVEVKFRNTRECIEESITFRQQQRVRRSASIFMRRYPGLDVRFDAILISYTGIKHVENAF